MTPDLLMDFSYSEPEHKVVLYAALRIYPNYKNWGDRYNSCMSAYTLDKLEPSPLAGLIVLIDTNADINAASHAGLTPIQVVKAFSRNEALDNTRSQILATTLIDWGADERIGTALR